MKLDELINKLRKLQDEGKGSLQVYARCRWNGPSGSCDPVGSPHVTNHVDELGPFGLKPNEEYISIYVGH